LVSDANAIIQILPAFKYSNVSYYKAGTDSLHTMNLSPNEPVLYSQNISISDPIANLVGGAILIRNISPTASNVTVVKGSLASSKAQNPYY